MTKAMIWAAPWVKNFGCRLRGFGFNLPPPIAESLERNPLRFAILSLIQRAPLPRLMVLAPESLAVTLTGSKFVGHVVSSLSKIHRRPQDGAAGESERRDRRQQVQGGELARQQLHEGKDGTAPGADRGERCALSEPA